MKKNDSKYFYTAQLMNQALLALLEKKDIDFITVTEITKKAGVNRSTFYLHYEDVYDLLEETIENLSKQFADTFNLNTNTVAQSQQDAFLITDKHLVPYLSFVKQNKRVLKLVNQKPQLFGAKRAYQKMYDAVFYPAIACFVKEENKRIYNLEFFTGGVTAIVHKWLELDCATEIDELVEIIKSCVNYSSNNQ